jgi:hypothetical protein
MEVCDDTLDIDDQRLTMAHIIKNIIHPDVLNIKLDEKIERIKSKHK